MWCFLRVERFDRIGLTPTVQEAGRATTGGAAGHKGRVSSSRALEREEQSWGKDSNTRILVSIRGNARR